VGEYLELKKKHIDLVTILCDQEGELKQGMELLAIFLSIYGQKNVIIHVDILWQVGASWQMVDCKVFAKKMMCHKPLFIFIVKRI
jgi:hypothetical protein